MKKKKYKNLVQKKIRVGFVYIEESFDTIFNMWWFMGRENRP